jgi:hypothetical protein
VVVVVVHRLRQRYRDLVRAEIANTVSSAEEMAAFAAPCEKSAARSLGPVRSIRSDCSHAGVGFDAWIGSAAAGMWS